MDGGTVRSMIPGVLAASSQAYRDGMAHVAGHVHVVTTAGAAGTSGFTAIAVASVSDDPPMLLVCLNRKSANGDLIGRNGVFPSTPCLRAPRTWPRPSRDGAALPAPSDSARARGRRSSPARRRWTRPS